MASMKSIAFLLIARAFAVRPGVSAAAMTHLCCIEHGGVKNWLAAEVLCKDGARATGCDCGMPPKPKKRKVVPPKELHFEPTTRDGQVLLPGETPPATTLEES